ncbi:MAG: hypothetical protein WCI89_03830 [bacterium]
MVPLLLSTLSLSILGILTLFALKQWELKTGKVLIGSIRPAVGEFFHTILFWIERVAPALVRTYAQHAAREVLAFVHRAVAFLVIVAEQLLQRLLHLIHHSTDVHRAATGEASAFLREVAEHKHKLLRSGQRGAVRLHKE